MKSQFSPTRAIIAGITGTIIMTLFTYLGGYMDIKMNIPEMLSAMFGGSLIMGWIMHFMVGTLLALNYSLIFFRKSRVNPFWFRGTIFGLIPWLMSQVIVIPLMKIVSGMSYADGFFSGSVILAMASLMGHLIYGSVVGSIYKPKPFLASV